MTDEFIKDVLDWLETEFRIDFFQEFLQQVERAFIDSKAVVTREDAENFQRKINESIAFEKMMEEFVRDVLVRRPGEYNLILMNTPQLNWIRSYHQRYQRVGLYKARKRDPGLTRKRPPYFNGLPVFIDEEVTKPTLDWQSGIGYLLII